MCINVVDVWNGCDLFLVNSHEKRSSTIETKRQFPQLDLRFAGSTEPESTKHHFATEALEMTAKTCNQNKLSTHRGAAKRKSGVVCRFSPFFVLGWFANV